MESTVVAPTSSAQVGEEEPKGVPLTKGYLIALVQENELIKIFGKLRERERAIRGTERR